MKHPPPIKIPNRVFVLAATLVVGIASVSCGPLKEISGIQKIEKRELAELRRSEFYEAFAIERIKLGISPLPESGEVRIFFLTSDMATENNYSVRLELREKSKNKSEIKHDILFSKTENRYHYVGEYFECLGPHEFGGPEATMREHISVRFGKIPTWGDRFSGLEIVYHGDDVELKNRKISPEQVLEVIKQWGYLDPTPSR